ncbi:hypothetical protein EDD16DRAFT_1122776 [Pisolithus croceorrhizus]|nr:hypothetical protein EDD16DRAFT_1122776 [Pisolithus croceorrhizus]KAI6133827.1 hypothetical protein EV401DRAFT_2252483 [Pisolithus croceorrhizus]
MTSTHESSSDDAAPAVKVGSTPIARRARTAHYHCDPPPLQDKMKTTLADETKRRYVGPVDPSQFLDDYMPCSNSTPTAPCLSEKELEILKGVAAATSENNMYQPFKAALERYACGMVFVETSNKSATDTFPLKPDFCLYEEAVGTSKRTNFSTAELCIEVKPHISYDPFKDLDVKTSKGKSSDPFEKDTVDANDTRGQITTYAVAQFDSQFRFFAFSLVIFGNHARFVRWDRGGAVVSARFNYVERSNTLVDFFWRFSRLSREGRGHDPSVSPANLSEEDAQKIREVLDLEAGTALFAFEVPHKDGNRMFYGPRFPFPVRSLIGRSTRTVPVCDFVDRKPGKKAFLKEYWRPEGMRGEVEVYEHLVKHGIPHIAPLMCGGDVPRGETRTHERARKTGSCPIIHRYLHRLVLAFVGRRLTQFKCTKELALVVLHAMEAHWEAYKKAKVLHRDVSVNNILINGNGEGVLIDWELAMFLDDNSDSDIIKRHDRTGTWQFISAALLRKPRQKHALEDDIESFVHVLGWTVLCYLPGPMDGDRRKGWVSLLYDYGWKDSSGREEGGYSKAYALALGEYPPKEFELPEHSPILELIQVLASPFRARYGEPPTEKAKQFYLRTKASVEKGEIDEDSIEALVAHGYMLGIERLRSSEWFLSTIQDALERPGWPDKDGAREKLIAITEGTSRQKQRATQRVEIDFQLLSASSGSLKRSNTPPPAPRQKRHHLNDSSDGGIARR